MLMLWVYNFEYCCGNTKTEFKIDSTTCMPYLQNCKNLINKIISESREDSLYLNILFITQNQNIIER